jgi:hypothetical protein
MPLTDKQITALQPEAKAKKYFDGVGMYQQYLNQGTPETVRRSECPHNHHDYSKTGCFYR